MAIKEEKQVQEVKTENKSVKVWTEEELAVLPRDQFLAIEKEIKEGKAKVQSKEN